MCEGNWNSRPIESNATSERSFNRYVLPGRPHLSPIHPPINTDRTTDRRNVRPQAHVTVATGLLPGGCWPVGHLAAGQLGKLRQQRSKAHQRSSVLAASLLHLHRKHRWLPATITTTLLCPVLLLP
jgi:hypothetical protein